jgi:hypothetical protein
MEFGTIVATYSYKTGTLSVQAKSEPENRPGRSPEWPIGAMTFPGPSIQELREALEGIGQQVPGTTGRPGRL